MHNHNMLEVNNLSKNFAGTGRETEFAAVDGISFTLDAGECLGLIGESGCGKSTTARLITGFVQADAGSVLLEGEEILGRKGRRQREVYRKIQMVFQTPQDSFDPMQTLETGILEAFRNQGMSRKEACLHLPELLKKVELSSETAMRYPRETSGGECQRAAIARALAVQPSLLICDEATSALDPKTTRSVLSLIKDINRKMGITVIVITHQMSVVEEICNKVSILDHGTVVEQGTVSTVFSRPKSEAAKRLVFPDGIADTLPIKEGEHHIRVVFNGADAANTPLIAKLAMETHIAANILGANTKSIEGKAYGNMLLGISGDENTLQQAIAYLQKIDDIIVEEVSAHVR